MFLLEVLLQTFLVFALMLRFLNSGKGRLEVSIMSEKKWTEMCTAIVDVLLLFYCPNIYILKFSRLPISLIVTKHASTR